MGIFFSEKHSVLQVDCKFSLNVLKKEKNFSILV